MPITPMVFSPIGGLNDPTYSPTNALSETERRGELQGIHDQTKDFINDILIPAFIASNIAIDTITGVTATQVQTALEWLQSHKPDTTTVYLKTEMDTILNVINQNFTAALVLKANDNAVVKNIIGMGGAQVTQSGNTVTINVIGSGGDMLQSNYASGVGQTNTNKVDHAIYADASNMDYASKLYAYKNIGGSL